MRKVKLFISFLPGSEVSVREESDTDQNQSDDGDTETSPTKSPTTPKSVKSKNSSGTMHQFKTTNRFPVWERAAGQVESRQVGVIPYAL